MKPGAQTIAMLVVLGLLGGVIVGSIVVGLAIDNSPVREKRGIMACAFDDDVQVVSFVPNWEPPESWRCAVAVEPREWLPEDAAWTEVLNLEIGGACGWTETAGACCPECLVWERGCPIGPEGCGDGP